MENFLTCLKKRDYVGLWCCYSNLLQNVLSLLLSTTSGETLLKTIIEEETDAHLCIVKVIRHLVENPTQRQVYTHDHNRDVAAKISSLNNLNGIIVEDAFVYPPHFPNFLGKVTQMSLDEARRIFSTRSNMSLSDAQMRRDLYNAMSMTFMRCHEGRSNNRIWFKQMEIIAYLFQMYITCLEYYEKEDIQRIKYVESLKSIISQGRIDNEQLQQIMSSNAQMHTSLMDMKKIISQKDDIIRTQMGADFNNQQSLVANEELKSIIKLKDSSIMEKEKIILQRDGELVNLKSDLARVTDEKDRIKDELTQNTNIIFSLKSENEKMVLLGDAREKENTELKSNVRSILNQGKWDIEDLRDQLTKANHELAKAQQEATDKAKEYQRVLDQSLEEEKRKTAQIQCQRDELAARVHQLQVKLSAATTIGAVDVEDQEMTPIHETPSYLAELAHNREIATLKQTIIQLQETLGAVSPPTAGLPKREREETGTQTCSSEGVNKREKEDVMSLYENIGRKEVALANMIRVLEEILRGEKP